MVKPEVHDTKSTGATCASNKDKILRTDKNHDHGKKDVLGLEKTGSENKKYRDKENEKLKLIINSNLDKFQMTISMKPGNLESAETRSSPPPRQRRPCCPRTWTMMMILTRV